MRAPFRYFGGKHRLASQIAALFPPHELYIEPCFGAGAVLFAKPWVRHEIINDVDDQVVNFYRVLRTDLDALVAALRLTPYARSEFNEAKRTYAEPADPVESARRFFTVVNQSFASSTGSSSGWSCSVSNNTCRARTTQNMVDRLHLVADRLRDTMIECRPAVEVIEAHATAGAVVYVDPPYVHSSRNPARDGVRQGGTEYRVEMTDDDHVALAATLNACPGTVFVSGYHSDLYDELYAGWDRVEFPTYSTVAAIRGRNAEIERTEVLWCNRPIMDGRLPL